MGRLLLVNGPDSGPCRVTVLMIVNFSAMSIPAANEAEREKPNCRSEGPEHD